MDTENLSITFGSNLIRPSEDLDINMIKGYNYNLKPLVIALIDNSEYLFPGNLNESCEQHNGSIRKSSGFSSFSSLLSSSDHQVIMPTRSSSLPSIPLAVSSLMDNANYSYNEQSDNHDVQYRSKSVTDKPIGHIFDQINNQQSSAISTQREGKQLPSTDAGKDEEINNTPLTTTQQKRKSGFSHQFGSKGNGSSTARKSSKKAFADKFGKSISNFKISMSKAFNPQVSSTENLNHANTIDISSSRPIHRRNEHPNLDSDSSADYIKKITE